MAAFDTTRTAYGSTSAVSRIFSFFDAFFAAVEAWQDDAARVASEEELGVTCACSASSSEYASRQDLTRGRY